MAFANSRPAPLADAPGFDPYASFRVDSPREVAALLRELNDSGTPIQLSTPEGTVMLTVLWSVDSSGERVSFRAEPEDPQLRALIDGDEATAVAYLEAVKLQFDLCDLVLVRGHRACALQARMPQRIYRFQRRQGYRVRPTERHAPMATLRHPSMPDMQLELRVLDVSFGGCALMLPDNVPMLEPGVTLHGVHVELDAGLHFICSLLLHHITSIRPGSGAGVRLGCEFHRLDPDAGRALQRWIDQTQKRRRLLSLS